MTRKNVYWGCLPGVKRPGREVYYLLNSSAEVKNIWSYTAVLSLCLHGVTRKTFDILRKQEYKDRVNM